MKVFRICEMGVKEFKEGDQIKIGKYTSTCVKVDSKDCTFLLDQYLDTVFRYKNLIPKLNKYLLKDKNFEEINAIAKPQDIYNYGEKVLYRVPFAGEMFSGTEEDEYIRKNYEPDTSEGFLDIWECAKDPKNRLAFGGRDNYTSGWLMNATNDSTPSFALVLPRGGASDVFDIASCCVRPVFVIEN